MHWVFTEEQYKEALRVWARKLGAGNGPCPDFQVVHDFLNSPEALEHKLRVEDKPRG